jgi:hypothetical protein
MITGVYYNTLQRWTIPASHNAIRERQSSFRFSPPHRLVEQTPEWIKQVQRPRSARPRSDRFQPGRGFVTPKSISRRLQPDLLPDFVQGFLPLFAATRRTEHRGDDWLCDTYKG